MADELSDQTRNRLLEELRRHLVGWLEKVSTDMSAGSFAEEIEKLEGDPVYKAFALARPEYALIRLMGRASISIGRRLGEIYDKLPRFVAQARFGLSADEVAPRIDRRLELDVCVRAASLADEDREHVTGVANTHLKRDLSAGLGIEIRYNFNPNDSARLRKDCEMAELLLGQDLIPVYLIFSTISPRDEAIARLTRAGWSFLVGDDATKFLNDLMDLDMASVLEEPEIAEEIARAVDGIMTAVVTSPAFATVAKSYGFQREEQST